MADNSRLISEEDLQKQLTQLEEEFEPTKWAGTAKADDVFQAYGGLAETLVRNFPGELKLAMSDYDRGQFDAKTREIVYGINKHMKTLRPEQQWGSQHAITGAKASAARALIEDPGYRQQRAEFQESLTAQNEKHLDMIYQAERQTLQALGLDPDHSPDGSKQSQRMQANLDLAEQYSDYRHNLDEFAKAQADLIAAIGEDTEREVEPPEAAKTDIERITERLEKFKQALREYAPDRREYDFQLTPGAYLAKDRAEQQLRIETDLAQDLEQLDRRSDKEKTAFDNLILRFDETIRDEEREQFEATGQPEPAERVAREAVRVGFYWQTIKEFNGEHALLQQEREDALRMQYAENTKSLDQGYEELKNPPEIEQALQEAKSQIEGLRKRQAGRSLAVDLLELAGNDRR